MSDTKRFTVAISAGHQDRLAAMAKEYQLSQGEVIEVLLDTIGFSVHETVLAFKSRRQRKVDSRTSLHAQMLRQRQARKEGKE